MSSELEKISSLESRLSQITPKNLEAFKEVADKGKDASDEAKLLVSEFETLSKVLQKLGDAAKKFNLDGVL